MSLAALTLAGCAAQTPRPLVAPIAPPSPPPPPRLAEIIGHGAYRTTAGLHGTCAGQSVALMHETVVFRRRLPT